MCVNSFVLQIYDNIFNTTKLYPKNVIDFLFFFIV